MEKRKKRIIFTSLIVSVLLGYLIFSTFTGGARFSQTVSEIKKDASLIGKPLRVSGKVVKGSFKTHSSSYFFKITDGKEIITLSYKGILPSSFQEGADVIAEGIYTKNKIFKVKNLLVKCPSKYIPKRD